MPGKTFKQIIVTGTSTDTIEDAVQGAVATAAKSIRHMRWFEVIETRGALSDGAVAEWQVTVKIGFVVEE